MDGGTEHFRAKTDGEDKSQLDTNAVTRNSIQKPKEKHLFQEENVRPVLVLPIPYEGGRKGGEDAGLLKSVPS